MKEYKFEALILNDKPISEVARVLEIAESLFFIVEKEGGKTYNTRQEEKNAILNYFVIFYN